MKIQSYIDVSTMEGVFRYIFPILKCNLAPAFLIFSPKTLLPRVLLEAMNGLPLMGIRPAGELLNNDGD